MSDGEQGQLASGEFSIMAGDWIKWVKGLAEKREVIVMAAALATDRYSVAGRLMRFWEWCDDNIPESSINTNGSAVIPLSPERGDNEAVIDSVVGLQGFASALSQVGWIHHRSSSVEIPNFARHNGETAKTRARNNVNQSRRRGVTTESPPAGDKTVTREEKRRVKTKNPPTPLNENASRLSRRRLTKFAPTAWNAATRSIPSSGSTSTSQKDGRSARTRW